MKTPIQHIKFLQGLAIALLLFCFSAPAGMAANRTWRGGSNGNWSKSQGWTSGVPVTGDTLFFAGADTNNNNDLNGFTFSGISFNAGASSFTLAGAPLSLGGDISNNSSNLQTIGLAMALTGTRGFNAASGNLAVSGIISGTSFGLTKTGSQTLTLSGANTYTGLTTISAGTLVLGTNGAIAGSLGVNLGTSGSPGTLDVSSKASFAFGAGQTVSGSGTINLGNGKTVTVTGAFAPGNSAGQISVTGNLTLAGATTMELASSGGVAGVDFDNTVVTGALTYGGSLAVVSFGGFDLNSVGTYDLFDFATGHSGNFASVTFGGSALTYDSGLSLWRGSNGSFDYRFALATGDLSIFAVPEQTTWGLLAMSLTIVVVFRRRSGCRYGRGHI